MKKSDKKEFEFNMKLIFKSSVLVFIGLVISKILGYAYRIIIARGLGPETYGNFSLALMVSGWLIALSMLGLTQGILRYISIFRGKKQINKIKYVLRYSGIILLITSLFSAIILFFLSEYIAINIFNNYDLITFLKIFSFIIPVSVFGSYYLAILRAYEKIGWHSFIFNILQNFSKVLFLGIFIFLGMHASAVSISYLIGIFTMLLAAYLVSKYKIPEIFYPVKVGLKEKEKRKISKELLGYSLPLLFFNIIWTVFYWVDSFFIGYFRTAADVGFYNAAIPIAALLTLAPGIFIQLFLPLITREYARNKIDVIRELSKQIGKWALIINIPVSILIFLFPGVAINFIFGSEYLIAETALRILIIGNLFSTLSMVSTQLISMIGKSKLFLINIIFAALLNLFLNYIFIPMQQIGFLENANGINGAALATTISMFFLAVLTIGEAKYFTSILPFRRKMASILLASIIPTVVLIYLRSRIDTTPFSIILLSALFFLLYVFIIFLIKGLDKNDWEIIRTVKKRFSRHLRK